MAEGKPERLAIVNVEHLRAGDELFKATGESILKVVRAGKAKFLRLPIKSTGVADVIEAYKDKEPRPPGKKELVEPASDLGRRLKLVQKQWVTIPDLTDPDYVKALERHQTDMAFAIILVGLDVPILDERGEPVTVKEEAVRILRGMHLSTEHFQQLVDDIRDLTRMTEEDKVAFFGGNSVPTANGG